jgi:hypothetical protein
VVAFFLDFFELSFIVVPLIGPVAEKLGVDLIWFGVLLGVNMQTSFMHPPFGFALFYLRSVAADKPYLDKLTKKTIAPVTTMQIYWGAVPFVLIQVLMVGMIIAFPKIVSRDIEQAVDLDKVKIEIPTENGMQDNNPFAPSPDTMPPAPESGASAPAAAAPAASDPLAPPPLTSSEEEDKKMQELFGTGKK